MLPSCSSSSRHPEVPTCGSTGTGIIKRAWYFPFFCRCQCRSQHQNRWVLFFIHIEIRFFSRSFLIHCELPVVCSGVCPVSGAIESRDDKQRHADWIGSIPDGVLNRTDPELRMVYRKTIEQAGEKYRLGTLNNALSKLRGLRSEETVQVRVRVRGSVL